MDYKNIAETVQRTIISSAIFPYRTGKLHDNFIDRESLESDDKSSSFTILSNKIVNYGKILEVAPSIRYRLRKNGYKYNYVKHKNRHYRYIERIIENDVIKELENTYGVKYVGK